MLSLLLSLALLTLPPTCLPSSDHTFSKTKLIGFGNWSVTYLAASRPNSIALAN